MDTIYEEDYKGLKVKILPDDESDNPRSWDNAGKLVSWHGRYNLGDEQPRQDPREWLAALLQAELEYNSPAWVAADDLDTRPCWKA